MINIKRDTVPGTTLVVLPAGDTLVPTHGVITDKLAIVTFDEMLIIVPSTCVFGNVKLAPKLPPKAAKTLVGWINTRFTVGLIDTLATLAVGLIC